MALKSFYAKISALIIISEFLKMRNHEKFIYTHFMLIRIYFTLFELIQSLIKAEVPAGGPSLKPNHDHAQNLTSADLTARAMSTLPTSKRGDEVWQYPLGSVHRMVLAVPHAEPRRPWALDWANGGS